MLRPITLWAIVLFAGTALAAEKIFDFTDSKLNEPPAGFTSVVGGGGKLGDWKIIMDESPSQFPPISPNAPAESKRPVLAQLSRDTTDEHFPMLIYDGAVFGDFTLATRFKIVDGKEEQMAGVAFRIQDEKNYYYVRASSLGKSFVFYKIVDGVRSLPIGAKLEIPKGVWHDLRIECKGTQIRLILNGQEPIPALGDKTFASGRIGFWTKSDSVSYFTDTKITYTPKEIFAQVLVRDALKRYPRLQGLKIFAAATNQPQPHLIASTDPKEIGRVAQKVEADVITRSVIYHGKENDLVLVTLPLHDSNGDSVAAIKVIMKSFPGQTEKNAIARALPIVKQMEERVHSLSDLTQ